jgi:hypothetical protein
MKDDPTIARIREARHRISEKCGHDPQRLVQYYRDLESRYPPERFVQRTEEKPAGPEEPIRISSASEEH